MPPPATPQHIEFPADAMCSACRRDVTLGAAERAAGAFDCPYCRRHVAAFLPSELRCPTCRNRLVLSVAERTSGTFTCDRCRGAFVTRAPQAEALVPLGSATALATSEARTRRLLTLSSALGWGGLGLAFVGGVAVGIVAGDAAMIPVMLGVGCSLAGAVVGQVARAGQRRLL